MSFAKYSFGINKYFFFSRELGIEKVLLISDTISRQLKQFLKNENSKFFKLNNSLQTLQVYFCEKFFTQKIINKINRGN